MGRAYSVVFAGFALVACSTTDDSFASSDATDDVATPDVFDTNESADSSRGETLAVDGGVDGASEASTDATPGDAAKDCVPYWDCPFFPYPVCVDGRLWGRFTGTEPWHCDGEPWPYPGPPCTSPTPIDDCTSGKCSAYSFDGGQSDADPHGLCAP